MKESINLIDSWSVSWMSDVQSRSNRKHSTQKDHYSLCFQPLCSEHRDAIPKGFSTAEIYVDVNNFYEKNAKLIINEEDHYENNSQ